MKSKYTLGLLFCLVSVVFWGSMFPIMTPALKIIDPFYFTLIRYGFVAIIFCVLLLLIEGTKSFKFDGKFLKLWFFGTNAFAGFSFLVFLGQKIAGPSGAIIASVMMAIQPLLGVLLIWFTKKEKPANFTLFAMVAASIGVVLVATKGSLQNLFSGNNTMYAMLLILLGAFCWVIYSTGSTQFPSWSILRYSTLTTVLGMLSVVFFVSVATIFGFLTIPTFNQIHSSIGALIYMIVPAGVIAVFTWNKGNRAIKPINGILFMNLVPITSFFISIILGYIINLFEIIGCMLTITSLVMVNVYNRTKV